MQTGNERMVSSWDGTELDVSDPAQHQKEETYVALLRVTERSLRAAFPLRSLGELVRTAISVPTSLCNHFNGLDSKTETQTGAE